MQNILKLNNKRYVRLFLFFVLLLSGFDLLMIFGCLTLSFDYNTFLLLAGIVFLLIFSVALSAIRTIEFETSAAIISIKCYHPFRKFWQGTLIEFPVTALHGFSIKGSKLRLIQKKDDDKLINISVRMQGMTHRQLRQLNNNLKKIIEYS